MTRIAAIDQALEQGVKSGRVPGVVAMAVAEDKLIYDGAFGRRGLPDSAAMTSDTVFWIASMTKAITGVAAMQLVEQGKLSLDAPIGALLPRIAEPKVVDGFDAAGKPRLRPARRPITLKHLLTHTAGYCYNTWNADLARYMEVTGLQPLGSGRKASLEAPLMFDPGARWEYGIGIDWAGQAVEAASGLDLNAYVQRHICAPLGLRDTGYIPSAAPSGRLASTFQRQPDGSLKPTTLPMAEAPEFFMGGGGMYSTAPDYLRFLRMLLGGGAVDGVRLLKPETVALMAQNHIGELDVGWLRTTMPDRSLDANYYPDQPQKWGLTFLINTRRTAEGRSPGSLAWAGLRNTFFWLDPQARIAGVIMMQVLPFVDPACMALFRAFERGVYQAAA
jgi:CubicO group peptidase (beta-lactamase class C family)